MSHAALLGDVEVPVTYSPQEAVGLLQQMGVVGAGGGGFPAYKKYEQPPNTLVVNAAESEPGYYADKLLLRDEPEAVIDVFDWMARTFSIQTSIIVAEEVAQPYLAEFEELARELRNFSIAYIPSKYKLGQERALVRAALGVEVGPKELPQDHGIVVNNNETLWNIYRAAFRERPVVTKFVHLYGEVTPLTVYEAPVGTLAEDLLAIHGTQLEDVEDCKLYDGGPILADLASKRVGNHALYPVHRTTNALLFVDPDKDRPRNAHYPAPDWEDHHNSIEAPWAPTTIQEVQDQVDRVRIPLTGRFQTPGPANVEVGDTVEVGDLLTEPATGELSVGCHASIPGEVTSVTRDIVEIMR